MVPTVVERSGRLDLARGPRIISLVLEAFNCMSLLSVHLSKLIKQDSPPDGGIPARRKTMKKIPLFRSYNKFQSSRKSGVYSN